ncbi:hypothetical protein Psi01_65540 [Planobispora siamensis]|uniref:Cyclic nucleotide-binding domain-containing protein n=1 Tax=Planobispora siamensis TaxID=936338 RepID=A0A8J3SME5_9ACTN|nr:hypothetical protein Psi01_65540 [Planobispora siamensis]
MRRNQILAAVPEQELQHLNGHLQPVALEVGQVLYRPHQRMQQVYFPLTGVVSLTAELEDEQVVEVATIGNEGMIGLPVFLGAASPAECASVQITGRALQMSAEQFRHEAAVLDGGLQAALQRYTQALFIQLARNAACNGAHSIRQRCARWLLMTADRV